MKRGISEIDLSREQVQIGDPAQQECHDSLAIDCRQSIDQNR